MCHLTVEQAWYVAERTGGLLELINRYKFGRSKAGYSSLGDLLLARLPVLPLDTVVVPIPTVRSHIRQRGYDHTLLIARYVATKRELAFAKPLERVGAARQRGAGQKQRTVQAKTFFKTDAKLQRDTPYLLIDDVVTTGATIANAAKTIRSAGATIVWAAAVARQPLDKNR